jgi:hypothetical protein
LFEPPTTPALQVFSEPLIPSEEAKMKLYYSPAACSLAPHIVAREAGIDIALEKVDLGSKKTETGRDYLSINPKGQYPHSNSTVAMC